MNKTTIGIIASIGILITAISYRQGKSDCNKTELTLSELQADIIKKENEIKLITDSILVYKKQIRFVNQSFDSINTKIQIDEQTIPLQEFSVVSRENSLNKTISLTGQLLYPSKRDFEIRGLLFKIFDDGTEHLVKKGNVENIKKNKVFFDYNIYSDNYLHGTYKIKLLFESNSIEKKLYY